MSVNRSNFFNISSEMWPNIELLVNDINSKLEKIEFLINPIAADYGTPYGFHTIGFSKVTLPEIYMSGVGINDNVFRSIYPFIKDLFTFLNLNGCGLHPSGEVCKVINEQLIIAGLDNFQARPIDPTRLMYGQAVMLRHWADQHSYTPDVQAIQIVHRVEDAPSFPVVSTENQLLVDYVPFGTACPEPISAY